MIGLIALTIGGEYQHAIADTARNDWRGEPAAVSTLFMISGQFQRVSVLQQQPVEAQRSVSLRVLGILSQELLRFRPQNDTRKTLSIID